MGDRYYKISDDIKRCVEFKKADLLKDKYYKRMLAEDKAKFKLLKNNPKAVSYKYRESLREIMDKAKKYKKEK